MSITLPPLSLYIHIPWCIKKCPYCDFNSHAVRNEPPEDNYIDNLLLDLKMDLEKMPARPLTSIFIGGGTPSLFSEKSIGRLLHEIEKIFSYEKNMEITLEANPGTVEKNKFAGFRKAGINRLSLGIQSFQADKLKVLGRIHDDKQAKNAIDAAIQAQFDNFNLDLMHGLPNQSIADAMEDIKIAMGFSPMHLSWYQLTLEPNTLFHRHPPKLPQDDLIWDMQEKGQQLLLENNYKQYEISAYSRPDKQCKHNRNYWTFGDYLGIGAGAHSKITNVEKQQITRAWKKKSPKEYLSGEKNFIAEEKIISKSELPFEFMLNTLRLFEDIPVDLFEKRTGLTLKDIQPVLQNAHKKSLLNFNEHTIQPTDLGRRFYNDLSEMFIGCFN
jgi:putative oxygen-independent coproporphyrinogen III oxidase